MYEPMPLDAMTSDREAIERWRATLAAGIRFARVPANEGDVFGPDVEALIRSRVRDMAGVYTAVPLDVDEGDGRRTPAVSINDSLPWGVAVRVPPDLLVALPPIPESLEYRLLGNDLLLWDARVDLVVDILREVVRAP